MRETSYWLWYPGDFEIRQGLKQNFEREERAYDWPAYWQMDDCHRNVKFSRCYQLQQEETICVCARGIGYAELNGQKYPLGKPLLCPAGQADLTIYVGSLEGLPSIYIQGEQIKTDGSWEVSNFLQSQPAAYNDWFTEAKQDPNQIVYQEELIRPQRAAAQAGGVLFDFGRLIDGCVKIETASAVTVCYGESASEALAVESCYHKEEQAVGGTWLRKRAFRYLFVPEAQLSEVQVEAHHQSLPHAFQASFYSQEPLTQQLWQTAATTFALCSNVFFIDGIKRDRWIWSGDAYQSIFINQYLYFDEAVNRRTLLALRGQETIQQHVNTIVDYSMLWVLSLEAHYQMGQDHAFIEAIYPKLTAMMTFLQQQTDEQGFIVGRKQDWLFIDWAELDKEGPLCAEQILFWKSLLVFAEIGERLGHEMTAVRQQAEVLAGMIRQYFWQPQLGCFIDGYQSGRCHVSRQTNIFALRFGFVKGAAAAEAAKVLLDDTIPAVTTPYFKFYELDALAALGELAYVWQTIREYWGGMLQQGATTFWEEYDPTERGAAMYEMYGDPYGKSLCHAWGASPIYLLSKYFVGLQPTSPGYASFELRPALSYLSDYECELPINGGTVKISCSIEKYTVTASKDGGKLVIGEQEYLLPKGQAVTIDLTT